MSDKRRKLETAEVATFGHLSDLLWFMNTLHRHIEQWLVSVFAFSDSKFSNRRRHSITMITNIFITINLSWL